MGEEGVGRKEQTKVIALANPFLEILERRSTPPKEISAAKFELHTVFVRQRITARRRIDPETQMDHALGREDSTLSRRDIITEAHGSVQEGVDSTRRLGTAGIL